MKHVMLTMENIFETQRKYTNFLYIKDFTKVMSIYLF